MLERGHSCGVKLLAKTLAAQVKDALRKLLGELRVRLKRKHMVVQRERRVLAEIAGGDARGTVRELGDLILMAGEDGKLRRA